MERLNVQIVSGSMRVQIPEVLLVLELGRSLRLSVSRRCPEQTLRRGMNDAREFKHPRS